MPIYTKTGDRGTTALFGGKRVKKYDPQIEAYGSVDELTSFIGLVISKIKNKQDKIFLTNIQKCLYQMMGTLCGATTDLSNLESEVTKFEKYIDSVDKKLPKLTRFILPQGTEASAWFHILRITCRKAERNVVYYFESNEAMKESSNESILKYLNRMSDLFFMMARMYNKGQEIVT